MWGALSNSSPKPWTNCLPVSCVLAGLADECRDPRGDLGDRSQQRLGVHRHVAGGDVALDGLGQLEESHVSADPNLAFARFGRDLRVGVEVVLLGERLEAEGGLDRVRFARWRFSTRVSA